jgi:hypothetical protein
LLVIARPVERSSFALVERKTTLYCFLKARTRFAPLSYPRYIIAVDDCGKGKSRIRRRRREEKWEKRKRKKNDDG